MTITQHQSEDGDQNEAILFRCQKCHEELLRHEYNATPKGVDGYDPSQWGGSMTDEVPMFTTLWGTNKAAVDYDDESVRTCPKCGHLNAPYPHHKAGLAALSQPGTCSESRETGTALSGTVGLRISGGVIMDRGAECCTTFKAAQEVGNYEDVPVRPADVDPQLYMSRNAVAQPFFLICGKDTVVVHMSGTADMYLKESSVRRFHMTVGDHVQRARRNTPPRVRRPRKVCNCDIKRDLLDWKALPGTAPDAIENCTAASGTPLKQSRSKSISTHASPSTTTSH